MCGPGSYSWLHWNHESLTYSHMELLAYLNCFRNFCSLSRGRIWKSPNVHWIWAMTSFPMHCIHPGELNSRLKGEMVVNCQWPDANVQTLETQSNNFFSIPSPSGLEGKSIGVHQEITFFSSAYLEVFCCLYLWWGRRASKYWHISLHWLQPGSLIS